MPNNSYSDRLTIRIKNMIDTLIDDYETNSLDWCVYGCNKDVQCDTEKVDSAIRTVDLVRLGGKNLIPIIINMLENSIPGRIDTGCAYGCTGPELDDNKIAILVSMLKKLENTSR